MEGTMPNHYIPYLKSNHFPHLSKEQRAMQFSPFSVLDGLDEVIKEAQYQIEEDFKITYEKLEEEYEIIKNNQD